jgi:hypothetical protein
MRTKSCFSTTKTSAVELGEENPGQGWEEGRGEEEKEGEARGGEEGRGEGRKRSGSKDKRSTGYVTGGNGYARTALEAQCSVQLGSSGERCQRLLAKTKDD